MLQSITLNKGIFAALLIVLSVQIKADLNEIGQSCANGVVEAGYTCHSIDLASVLELRESGLEASRANDIWGWTDPETGREFALMGMDTKTAIVEVSDPANPIHVGDLPTHEIDTAGNGIWRDIKVVDGYAYVVSEIIGHGMQILDMQDVVDADLNQAPVVFEESAHYDLFGSAHNVVMSDDTDYVYAVGTNTCDAGMHVVNVADPLNPVFSTCIDKAIFEDVRNSPRHGEDYTHDAQCVIYNGPDTEHVGKELCVASNADTVNIVDVTDKANPQQLSVKNYQELGYTHQGWLTEDHRYFLLGDELDEMIHGVNTTTIIWDVSDLENPEVIGRFVSDEKAIDHNMYVKGNYVYQSNYEAGLRILSLDNIENGELEEVAFFDSFPDSTNAAFNGAWSVFPYFDSGTVVLSDINEGKIFVLRPQLP